MGNGIEAAFDPQSVNAVLKQAGMDSVDFSVHGLRSGHLTEAAKPGHPSLGSDGPIETPIGTAGIGLLQQRPRQWNAVGDPNGRRHPILYG